MKVSGPKSEYVFVITLSKSEYDNLGLLKQTASSIRGAEVPYEDLFATALKVYQEVLHMTDLEPTSTSKVAENASASAKHRKRHPQKAKARSRLSSAIASGKMRPAKLRTCVECGRAAESYHHHKGYAEGYELDVIAVCNSCHRRIEKQAFSVSS